MHICLPAAESPLGSTAAPTARSSGDTCNNNNSTGHI